MSYNSRTFFPLLREEKKSQETYYFQSVIKFYFLAKTAKGHIAWAAKYFLYIYCIYVFHFFLSAALEDFKRERLNEIENC